MVAGDRRFLSALCNHPQQDLTESVCGGLDFPIGAFLRTFHAMGRFLCSCRSVTFGRPPEARASAPKASEWRFYFSGFTPKAYY